MIRNGLRWRDAPEVYGPHKTLYNRFARWSRMGVFAGIFSNLAADDEPPDCLMIDSTHLKAHRTAASLQNGTGRPIIFLLTEGQMSDHQGAAIIYPKLPTADMLIGDMLIGDKGYDSDAFRDALTKRGITPCITPRANRRLPATYCKALCKQRHEIENMFARLKDWRRISMRYDRCAHTFFSAICIAATVIFWINQCVLILVTGQGVGLGEVHLLP